MKQDDLNTCIAGLASAQISLFGILFKHLEYDSPYNTYLHEGLPPGPICVPDKASLEAVLNPDRHGYLFFCASAAMDDCSYVRWSEPLAAAECESRKAVRELVRGTGFFQCDANGLRAGARGVVERECGHGLLLN